MFSHFFGFVRPLGYLQRNFSTMNFVDISVSFGLKHFRSCIILNPNLKLNLLQKDLIIGKDRQQCTCIIIILCNVIVFSFQSIHYTQKRSLFAIFWHGPTTMKWKNQHFNYRAHQTIQPTLHIERFIIQGFIKSLKLKILY